ncbi:hypothetical protein M5689_016480 [Euphorbia peplus]|nr:hypothetical protein M5689_016480 [Euphorbia peplus]
MSSSPPEFDSVKAEKADAIRRYNNRNKNYIFNFHRLLTALALLCSFPYFPLLKQVFSDYFSVLNRQIYVFVLINAMIFIIYHFSNAAVTAAAAAESPPDLYDQYVSFSSLKERKSVVSPAIEVQSPEEDKFCDKQIVLCETENLTAAKDKTEVSVIDNDEEIKFRRTRSEKFTTVRKNKGVLRRSETEIGRELVLADGGGDTAAEARKSMEDMNSDEFRFTIERFIASKKKVLRDENFAVVMQEEEE